MSLRARRPEWADRKSKREVGKVSTQRHLFRYSAGVWRRSPPHLTEEAECHAARPSAQLALYGVTGTLHMKPREALQVLIGGLIERSCSGGGAVDERFLRGREIIALFENIGEERKDPKQRP